MDLRFEIPSVCADLLAGGAVDIGLIPAIELERQVLEVIPDLGIASRGEVRSILLISRIAPNDIETLAVDAGSRTSAVLSRLILAEKFRVHPRVIELNPDVEVMLNRADACVVIGDPALRVDRGNTSLYICDLGAEWTNWTGLPMVYAVWAARPAFEWRPVAHVLCASWEYGRDRIDEIAAAECAARGVSPEIARDYLTRNICFELDAAHARGLVLFRNLARGAGLV